MDINTEMYKQAIAKDRAKAAAIMEDTVKRIYKENPALFKEFNTAMEEVAYSIDSATAEQIVRKMEPYGQYWSMSAITDYLKTKGVTERLTDYYLVMNMMYNDYYETASAYGLQKNVDFFFSLAKNFIEDRDAKPHKVAKYFMG